MDEIDRAQRHEQRTRNAAIDHALAKSIEIEKPDEYNGIRYCLDCGLEVPEQRLIARPESVRCVECKQIKEQRGQHRG